MERILVAILVATALAGCSTDASESITFRKAPADVFVQATTGEPRWDRVAVESSGSCLYGAELSKWPTTIGVANGPVTTQAIPVTVGDRILVDTSHAPDDQLCELALSFDGRVLGSWQFAT